MISKCLYADCNGIQEDRDGDKVGDVCDVDIDGDLVVNKEDKCPHHVTQGDNDSDGDGVPDNCDNCVHVNNPYQQDSDQDGVGDHCQCLGIVYKLNRFVGIIGLSSM